MAEPRGGCLATGSVGDRGMGVVGEASTAWAQSARIIVMYWCVKVLIDGDIRVVRRRQASLDTFRGLVLALTIFISYGGGGKP